MLHSQTNLLRFLKGVTTEPLGDLIGFLAKGRITVFYGKRAYLTMRDTPFWHNVLHAGSIRAFRELKCL